MELATKDNDDEETQSQLTIMKMEAQVQYKQLVRWKEVMAEANKQIAHLMEQLQEGPQKTTLHMKK